MLSTISKYYKYIPYVIIVLLAVVLLFGSSKYKKTRAERKRDKEKIEQLEKENDKLLKNIQVRSERVDSLLLIVSEGNNRINRLEADKQRLKDKLNEKTNNIPNLSDSELQDAFTRYPKTRRRLK